MLYRTFPAIPGLQVSILGFGAMRLPVVGGDPARIDEEPATALLHAALRAGVNYVDTAWPYHAGQSEPFVGRALAGGLRTQVHLATKCPVWDMSAEADYERVLDEQLRRLQTDHVDFYLLHALDRARWEKVLATGGIRAMERALSDGRVRHLGFSFHGPVDDFKAIIGGYDWAFTQLQLNYVDRSFQAGLEGLACAAARGIGAIAMEPLRGGALARVPPGVEAALGAARRPWSPVEWALRWVWAQAGVVTLLSGMNAPEQLAENARAAGSAEALGPADQQAVDAARQFYAARMAVPCTSCGYCQPCSSGVAIADVFNAWNSGRMFEDRRAASAMYECFVKGAGKGADQCEACGDCETKCPQHIAIAEELERAEAWLGAASERGAARQVRASRRVRPVSRAARAMRPARASRRCARLAGGPRRRARQLLRPRPSRHRSACRRRGRRADSLGEPGVVLTMGLGASSDSARRRDRFRSPRAADEVPRATGSPGGCGEPVAPPCRTGPIVVRGRVPGRVADSSASHSARSADVPRVRPDVARWHALTPSVAPDLSS